MDFPVRFPTRRFGIGNSSAGATPEDQGGPPCNSPALWSTLAAPKWCLHSFAPRLANRSREEPTGIYQEIVEGKQPDVLTVHPDYFLIEPGIGRFVYRLARRAAGKGEAKWSFRTIYERSGSTGQFKDFSCHLRKIIASNDLPEYDLREERGQSGPLLIMTYRNGAAPLESGQGG